jgi:hypothetical protein
MSVLKNGLSTGSALATLPRTSKEGGKRHLAGSTRPEQVRKGGKRQLAGLPLVIPSAPPCLAQLKPHKFILDQEFEPACFMS